ncbi:MAG: hypothetical protein WBW47_00085 [Thermoplasmata archaeon]
MSTNKGARRKKAPSRLPRRPVAKPRPRFVGREASPVLDRYPARESGFAPRSPSPGSLPSVPAAAPTAPSPAAASPAGAPAQPLITLDRPFDADEFSTLLGGTSIRVTVPREALAEVLRRVIEFTGFGIYVYSISVHPAPTELLKSFVVELQRVDYSAEKRAWVPFVEKGTVDSPFGPSGGRS